MRRVEESSTVSRVRKGETTDEQSGVRYGAMVIDGPSFFDCR